MKALRHHLLQPGAPGGSALVRQQPEGLRLGGLLLLLLWEDDGVKVWQRLGFELRHLRLQQRRLRSPSRLALKDEDGGMRRLYLL